VVITITPTTSARSLLQAKSSMAPPATASVRRISTVKASAGVGYGADGIVAVARIEERRRRRR
jgi:hypothetical protein